MIVLTYHSHNISGSDYASNDHIALETDLRTITSLGCKIASLSTISRVVETGQVDAHTNLVGVSFDDGPIFDYGDFVHPQYGAQRGFLNIMRDFIEDSGTRAQPDLHATSFVIASRAARQAMETSPECGFPYLKDWLTDRWWREAVETGLVEIGNHSWDHVHPAPQTVALRSGSRGDFTRVDNYIDATSQIKSASDFINNLVDGRCKLFAYPFGHSNRYLSEEYLPKLQDEHGLCAAFGAQGRGVRSGDSVWNIPRAICGFHWKSKEGLVDLIQAP